MSLPVLQIIVASTRPGRVGLPVAQWFARHATDHGGFEVEIVDLAEIDLPMFNEPAHPRLGQYAHAHTKRWSEVIARGDAFVFVTPEYNYGFNAALKNAIDYLYSEWQYKAAGFVSYGGIAGGTRAVQMLKQVLTTLSMVPVFSSVNIAFVGKLITDEGGFEPTEALLASADAMLGELASWTPAVAAMRT